MKIEHFQSVNSDLSAITIETAEISCPHCHQYIRMVVPDSVAIHDYKEEAEFLRIQNDTLRRQLFQSSEVVRCLVNKT